MGLHLVAVAKLPFLQIFKLSPLLWPFNLYLPLARHLSGVCKALSTFSTFFVFRLQQIFTTVHQGGRDTRWERALRLFHQEFIMPRRTQQHRDTLDEDSIHALLSVAL